MCWAKLTRNILHQTYLLDKEYCYRIKIDRIIDISSTIKLNKKLSYPEGIALGHVARGLCIVLAQWRYWCRISDQMGNVIWLRRRKENIKVGISKTMLPYVLIISHHISKREEALRVDTLPILATLLQLVHRIQN